MTESPQAAEALARFGHRAESLACSEPSDQLEVAMIERSAPRGSMPPLVKRNEDETYRLLDGEVTFYVDGETVSAYEGDIVVAPAGAARSFRVESPHARWVVLTRVRSLDHFRDFARAVCPAAAGGWPCEEERMSVATVARSNGIELLGPPGVCP